jgi:uncharacterized protein
VSPEDWNQAFIMSELHHCALLEGIVTTADEAGTTHISAMGPRVNWPTTRLLLRPFQSSTTFHNLARTRRGILHVIDDVLLLARAAIGRLPSDTPTIHELEAYPHRLVDCVRWYAFEVDAIDDGQDRTEIECHVTAEGRVRDFFGFNRARHAVIEAAILATRLHLISMEKVMDDFGNFATIIDKTAGDSERQAFAELQQYLNDRMGEEETRTMLDS